MSILYCDTNLQKSIFCPDSNSDPSILYLQGTSRQIVVQIDNLLLTQNSRSYSSLRIMVKGTLIRQKRYCCQAWTFIAGTLIVLPLFAFCTDCFKQKVQRIQEVKEQVYRSIGQLLKAGNFTQLYLSVEDNLLNGEKVELLREAIRGKVKNLFFNNTTRAFNVLAQNYDHAPTYFQALLQQVGNAQCRWDKEVWTNLRFKKV